jgi:very-short-patch-repair endonuclease
MQYRITADRHCQRRAALRKRATPAEHAFRQYLTDRKISFREQQGFYYPFYRIADFYLPDQNLIIEIDGGYHDAKRDRYKDARFLGARGIKTLRLTNEQVLSGQIPELR